jgi:hypothetical protein
MGRYSWSRGDIYAISALTNPNTAIIIERLTHALRARKRILDRFDMAPMIALHSL